MSALFSIACAMAVAACSGSQEGGGNIGFADGQEADPVAVDFPVAYIKRVIPEDEDGDIVQDDIRELITFNVGADLFVRDRASPSAPERNVTEAVTEGAGDIQDLDISWDGTRVVFAMRGPLLEDVDEDEQPTWNIWEYDIVGDVLRRVIVSDITAEAGHDIAPTYLPDGRIVFTSTRQRQSRALLLDEGKPQYAALDEDRDEHAFVLHVMNADGSDVHQVSFNQSHDMDPAVLSNGQVVFSRWDNAVNVNEINLYRMNPDGSALELLYGSNSHATGTEGAEVQFLEPREMPDGRLATLVMPFEPVDFGADVVLIDAENFVENDQPVAVNAGAMSGPAQSKATVNDVRTDGAPSPGGSYSSVFPLFDGTDRLLMSWSQCRLIETEDVDGEMVESIVPCTQERLDSGEAVVAPPIYGLWIYDRETDTQLPVVAPEEGVIYTEIVAAQPRDLPPVLFDGEPGAGLDPVLAEEGVGILDIRSVYDINGVDTAPGGIAALADPAQTTGDERPVRFIRIVKPVSEPDDDVLDIPGTAFGRSGQLRMREILAYAPVEPDGSVRIKVPGNVPFGLELLDARGRRVSPLHRNWLQVRPGGELTCNGCHDPDAGVSHGRQDAFNTVYGGAQTPSVPFPNTQAALFADFGETMAQTRTRISCADDCAALTPSVDLAYEDVWTDSDAAGRTADAPFAYTYSDLETDPPTEASCTTAWSARCRIVINYEAHIHPLWSLPRVTLDADEVTVLADNTCNTCHNPADAMGQPQVPAGQLDLTDGPSPNQADHFNSFRELLFGDNELEVNMGALQDRLVEVGIDPDTGDPIFQTVPVAPSMRVGANASGRFFSRFDAGGSHVGWLSPAELRLLSEWLDIGAQYYNNPFDVPVN
ncbi:MAG: hypothetical protein AAFN78_09190 [Pseudomonadota bacterium]